MGRCKDNTKKVLKVIWGVAKPIVLQKTAAAIGDIEAMAVEDPVFWTDHNKRTVLLSKLKATAREAGQQLKDTEARLITEALVFTVKKAGVAVEDIGTDDPEVD